jgi:uncharacterized protein YneF (UPF0154 family)
MDTWIMWIVGCSIAYWIGVAIGKHISTYNMMKAMARDPEGFMKMAQALRKIEEASSQEEIDSVVTDLNSNAVEMELEEVNGCVYAYNKTTGQFLAQAHDVEQAVRIASQRFPGQTFWHPNFKKDNQTA